MGIAKKQITGITHKEFCKNILNGSDNLNQKDIQTANIRLFKSIKIRINFLSQTDNFVIKLYII